MTEPIRPQRVSETTADALRRGDRQAFEELYTLLHAGVYNLAARIVGDRGEAEDITQEVFLRAFRHLPGTDGPLRPEAWMFRATVNACYDHLRRRQPVPTDMVESYEGAARDGFAQAAIAAAVEKALAAVNPRYRTVLVLKDLHGLGNGEIADIMGVRRGTVGVLLFRARGAFEKRYRELAPTVGAGLPVAGLVTWLPTLPVPAALQTPPVFVAPVAAPLTAAPLAAGASSVAPGAAGLGKLAGLLTSKIAVVAIAATAVVGGGAVVHQAGTVGATQSPPAAAAAAPATTSVEDGGLQTTSAHAGARGDRRGPAGAREGDGSPKRTRDGDTAGSRTRTGDGSGSSSTRTGVRAGPSAGGVGSRNGVTSASPGSGTQTGSGDGTGAGTSSGDGGSASGHGGWQESGGDAAGSDIGGGSTSGGGSVS